jgi:hypothetical protein
MIYRGVYRDGIVILEGDVDLQNGEPVSVSRGKNVKSKSKAKSATRGRKPAAASAKSRTPAANRSAKHPLPGFGAWKHRTDIADSVAFARALRRKTGARGSAD